MKHTITLKQFKLTLITCLVLSLTLVFGSAYVDSPSVKPQFFVEGSVRINNGLTISEFNITLGTEHFYFRYRESMLAFMNSRGYTCVAIGFNTHVKEGREIYIFE